MKLYITLGQSHAHRVNNVTLDKDCVVSVECKDEAEGRKKAFELFDDKFAFTYTEMPEKTLRHFPRGIIEVDI